MISAEPLLPLAAFQAASRRIASRVRATPAVWSPWLSDATGGDVYLKLESLQITGSFKLRGAFNAALALAERVPRGAAPPLVVTASAGNHGRGLAWAARALGLGLVVFTPRDAPAAKRDAIRRLGADLRDVADSYEETERLAKEHAAASGAVFMSPYNDPDVVAGAGTVALELLEQVADLDLVLIPVGGGGLASGVGTVVKGLAPTVEVVGVEVEASHVFTASIAAGRIVEVAVGPTLADGLAGNMDPESITFEMVRRVVDRIVLVGEAELAEAMRSLVTREHLVVEGAAAASVAAVLGGGIPLAGRRAACIVSGGNVDAARLAAVLSA